MPIKPRRSVRLNLETLEERDVPSSSITGLVIDDANNNGIRDPGELGLAKVTVTLTGHDNHNNSVNLTALTDAKGTFYFGNLAAGVYSLLESPAPGYSNGLATAGSVGGTVGVGSISNIALPNGVHDIGVVLDQLAPVPGWTWSQSNFNRTAIHAGSTIWFSSVFAASGQGDAPVTLQFTGQTISYQLGGSTVTLPVPDSTVILSPTASTASTAFDDGSNSWVTTVPSGLGGYKFLGGVAVPLSSSLPASIKNITWQGQFTSDTAGITVHWQWAATVYTTFGGDYNSLNVKPVDNNYSSQYLDSDHVGTPEAFTQYVVAGATGGGGSDYAGTHSGAVTVAPAAVASLSGYVFNASNGVGIGGVTVYLEDSSGDILSTTSTNSDGSYNFVGLQPGTYQLVAVVKHSWSPAGEQAGTVNGQSVGSDLGNLTLGAIDLSTGNAGVDYDFYMVRSG